MSGRIVNVRPKPGFALDSETGSVISQQPFRDGALANILTGRGTSVDRGSHNFWIGQSMQPQQIEAAYRGSWLMRQIVDIPADDQTRAGRDWDADDEEIKKIEAEERRIGYWQKVRTALTYGRLGGGALFINLGDDPASPLPNSVRPEQIVSLVPLYRTHLTIGTMEDDVLDPYYGEPTVFRINTPQRPIIHPSRLIIFKGQPVPGIYFSTWEDRFWGDSIIQIVNEAVQNATTATSGFASLIDEAKVDVFTFKALVETLAQPGGEAKFMERLQVMATGKSMHRMVALGDGDTWETRELQFAGAKDLVMTYMGLVAGAADIPATRLLGKSPDGMNSTGEGDLSNYFQSIAAQQETDLRPALMPLDRVLLGSAGVATDLTYAFSPLRVLTEKEQAEIENKEADTLSKLVNTGLFADQALEQAYSNRMIESERWPGYKDARDEAEAEGKLDFDEPEVDPSALAMGGGDPDNLAGGGPGSRPARRAANDFFADASPRPLYVQRKLLNAADLIAWAKVNGFDTTVPAADMHVTVLYSRTSVDPMKMGRDWREDEKGQIIVRPGGPRAIERLGENAVVLRFACPDLDWRHKDMIEAGGSHDYPEYQPHVTISYGAPSDVDLDTLKPFNGELRFGPEIFEVLDLDWKSKLTEQ
jgi:phage-related protein (TIGR01555 family)